MSVCLYVRPSVRPSVCHTFPVTLLYFAITQVLLILMNCNFMYGYTLIRKSVMYKVCNSGTYNNGYFPPLSHFLVWTITPVLLTLLLRNFIYGQTLIRESVIHKVHNSGIYILELFNLSIFRVWKITFADTIVMKFHP